MAGYRVDQRARCTKCDLVVAPEDLFHTVEGDALCAKCKIPWADEQARIARQGGGGRFRPLPGFRLWCTTCNLASMETGEGDFLRVARCLRCGEKTRQLRSGVYLAAMLPMMAAYVIDVGLRVPVAMIALSTFMVALTLWDQIARRRHRVATVDEIEHADSVLKGDRQRVAADALRVAEPDPVGATEQESQAELEADVEAQAKRHTS